MLIRDGTDTNNSNSTMLRTWDTFRTWDMSKYYGVRGRHKPTTERTTCRFFTSENGDVNGDWLVVSTPLKNNSQLG